jgi:SNF2 family DNA or RNA helicase
MIPCGREFTIQFSPTRRNQSKVERKTCVLCHQGSRPSIPIDRENLHESCVFSKKGGSPNFVTEGDHKETKGQYSVKKETPKEPKGQNRVKPEPKKKMNTGNEKVSRNRVATDLDLDNEVLDDNEFDEATDVQEVEDQVGENRPLIALECCKKAFGVQHYAHEACFSHMGCVECPRCQDGRNRSMLNTEGFDSAAFQSPIYCKEILGGFKGSSKINEVVKAVKDTNPDDKILVLSFFKSSLDLLEGIFTYDLKIECARFDGDFSSHVANAQLENFKKNASVRILLATVQSGGTGLNIVEANNVFFVSPFVCFPYQPLCQSFVCCPVQPS